MLSYILSRLYTDAHTEPPICLAAYIRRRIVSRLYAEPLIYGTRILSRLLYAGAAYIRRCILSRLCILSANAYGALMHTERLYILSAYAY